MARAILQCKGLWCANGKIGCNWKVVQLEYEQNTLQLGAFAFRTGTHVSNEQQTTNMSDEEIVMSDED